MGKENQLESVNDHDSPPVKNEEQVAETRYSTDSDSGSPTCRVCHSSDSDRRGDAALSFLGITPPVQTEAREDNTEETTDDVSETTEAEEKSSVVKNIETKSGFLEVNSTNEEVFICTNDIEMGVYHHHDTLLELGCSCKNELGLVHYACALKWFLNHGSTVCEICGKAAENVKASDFNKVVTALRDHKALRGSTVVTINTDEEVFAAIRRQRLGEICSWFGPHNNNNNNNNGSSVTASQVMPEQPSSGVASFDILPMESRATKWAVEGTGILFATGLLTATLVWIIAPRVGKKAANNGLIILLGGLCALVVVLVFRFAVLSKIKYGPARYWIILFLFWFLVFGIWASRANA